MSESRSQGSSDADGRFSALISNTSAIKAITAAVEGTIGPKGLDTMLVDRSGDIVVTNAGVTILDLMEVSHPAARMLINIARSQHAEIGDGTTTATIMAGTLITEGLGRVIRGVPVTRVIQGIRLGINTAIEHIKKESVRLRFPLDPLLNRVALVAGRGDEEMAENITKAAEILGFERLMDPSFRLKEIVSGTEGSQSLILEGVAVKKRPLNESMPKEVKNPVILCLDDALEPDRPREESLRTDAGFQLYIRKESEFEESIRKLIGAGVNVILAGRGIWDTAEQILTDAGVLVLSRVPSYQMQRVARHTGAVPFKKQGLFRPPEELSKYLGKARLAKRDSTGKNFHFIGGAGIPTATYLVGAPTEEVAGEKERIASDGASAVQAAVRGGIVAGGGAAELSASRAVSALRIGVRGMEAFGLDCVTEALKAPMACIVQNAGFNPLEKVEEALAAQNRDGNGYLAVDCDSGHIVNMLEMQIIDPTLVKLYALKAAGEVAQAVLRINTIIRMKDSGIPADAGPIS